MTEDVAKKVADGIAKDIGPVEPVPLWEDRLPSIVRDYLKEPADSDRYKQARDNLILVSQLADEAEAARKAKQ